MNDYEARQERRRQRLIERAAKKQAEADASFVQSRAISEGIPLGQPILIGHHSERRHRRDLDRSHRAIERGIAASREAQELRGQAASVGSGGISSDDPNALQKLQAQLEKAEASHMRMVATNKLVRKRDRAGLLAAGFGELQIERMLTDAEPPFAAYQLTNSSANIRRLKARIAELPQRAQKEQAFAPIEGDGWRIYAEDNRICIAFAERVSRERYAQIRSHGFVWSRTRNAFVRKFSNQALYWARQLVGLVG